MNTSLCKYVLSIDIIICFVILIMYTFYKYYVQPGAILFRLIHNTSSINTRKNISTNKRLSILKSMYYDVMEVSDQYNIPICLLYGTLLGKVRENDLICYDYDIDMGVSKYHYNALKNAFTERYDNDPIYRLNIYSFCANQIVLIHRETGLNLDMSCLDYDDKHVWRDVPSLYSTLVLKECSHKLPKEWMFPFRPVMFLGRGTYIPNKPDKILQCYYLDYEKPSKVCNESCTICENN
mgnify:CR=1 FL=1